MVHPLPQREGVVERRRGVGTFVSAPKIQFNKLTGYMELMASRGLSALSKVVYSGVRTDEYGIATRLSLPFTCPLIKIERVRLASAGGRPSEPAVRSHVGPDRPVGRTG